MPSGAQRRIAERKRQEFQDRRQRNRITGQLNREYAALRNANPNASAEEIFAMQRGATATVPGVSTTTTTPTGTTGPTLNGPANRSGFMGEGSPRTGPASAPAWWRGGGPANRQGIPGVVEQNQRPPREGETFAPDLFKNPQTTPTYTNTGGSRPLYRPGRDPFAGISGNAGGTPSTIPAWLSSVVNRKNLAGGLAGLGLASQAMPLFGGTLAPAFASLTSLVNPQRGPVTPAQAQVQRGIVQSRTPDPMTGIPDFPMLTQTGPQFNFSGGGGNWYSNYRRRGRGGGGGRRWAPRTQGAYPVEDGSYNSGPAWSRGLANWSIG